MSVFSLVLLLCHSKAVTASAATPACCPPGRALGKLFACHTLGSSSSRSLSRPSVGWVSRPRRELRDAQTGGAEGETELSPRLLPQSTAAGSHCQLASQTGRSPSGSPRPHLPLKPHCEGSLPCPLEGGLPAQRGHRATVAVDPCARLCTQVCSCQVMPCGDVAGRAG